MQLFLKQAKANSVQSHLKAFYIRNKLNREQITLLAKAVEKQKIHLVNM